MPGSLVGDVRPRPLEEPRAPSDRQPPSDTPPNDPPPIGALPVTIVLGVHLAVAVLCAALGSLGRRVLLVGALAPLTTLAWALAHRARVLDGEAVASSQPWVRQLGLALDFRTDGFSLVFLLLVGGIGVLVFAYASRYFDDRRDLGRFTAILVVFAGAMAGIVTADNLLALAVFWELTSVTSYLLIGFDDRVGSVRASALQAMLTTGLGGLAMLGGFVVLADAAGTSSLSAILADPPSGTAVSVAVGLVLLGAFTKSAQAPFHFWLPGAMAASTPVSAYLHSATMVKAGIYLIARLAPAFAGSVGYWRPLVVAVGLTTMVVGGYRALRQHDLKLVLAFGTVSQLGFIVALVGAGVPELTAAGTAVLVGHALFKACLFMVVGIVDHQAHTRDLRHLDGLVGRMPATAVVAALAAASMVGLPATFGFVAKELAVEGELHSGLAAGSVALGVLLAGSALTTAYAARFLWGAFGPHEPSAMASPVGADVAPPRPAFLAPAALLAGAGVLAGLWVALPEPLVAGAAEALDHRAHVHLSAWHGFTGALALSAGAVAAGLVLFWRRVAVEHWQARVPALPGGAGAYHRTLAGLNEVARRVTGAVQSGSLPRSLGVVLVAAVLPPAAAFLAAGWPAGDHAIAESPFQVFVAGIVVLAALAATRAERRFTAVLLLGAVGYGVTVLFVIQGAADLALTQLLIETLSIVLFVLVLRLLPDRFRVRRSTTDRGARIVVATLVGLFAAGALVVASGVRTEPSVSDELVARSLPEGGGRNVVNVVLVDIRGFDTMGEITVLATAALGVLTLIRTRREGQSLHEDDAVAAAPEEAHATA